MMSIKEEPLRFYVECELRSFRSIPNTAAPEIRLQGLWLNQMGFNPGDKIAVAVKEGKILLWIADDNDPNDAAVQF